MGWGLLGFLPACQAPQEETTPESHATKQTIESFRYQMDDLLQDQPLQTMEVAYDYTFHEPVAYEAYAFGPILRKLLAEHELDSTQAVVQLFCKDGYAPIQTCAELLAGGGGYVAVRDLRQGTAGPWTPDWAEKMAPYYLVWEQGAKVDKHLSWPFGLTEIELRSHSESYQLYYPTEQPALGGAYELFRINCQKCHALDGHGGSMGPDFHGPRNITEYWQRADIVAFAQSPQSYRINSHMPAIQHLEEADLNQIVDYLSYLAQNRPSVLPD